MAKVVRPIKMCSRRPGDFVIPRFAANKPHPFFDFEICSQHQQNRGLQSCFVYLFLSLYLNSIEESTNLLGFCTWQHSPQYNPHSPQPIYVFTKTHQRQLFTEALENAPKIRSASRGSPPFRARSPTRRS